MRARRTGSISIGGALALLGLALLGTTGLAAVAIGLEVLRHGAPLDRAIEALRSDVLLLSVCQLGGLGLATAAGVIWVHGSDARLRDALDVRPVPAAVVVLAITAGLAMQFPLSELANLLAEVHPSFAIDEEARSALRRLVRVRSLGDAVAVSIAVVAIPAVSEELFFRGLLLPALGRRYGRGVGLALSALLFGAMHVMPVAIVYATVAGLVLGLVRLRTGSVLVPIAMHGAFNAVPVLLSAELARVEGFNTEHAGVDHLPLALTLGGALVTLACLILLTRLAEPHEQS